MEFRRLEYWFKKMGKFIFWRVIRIQSENTAGMEFISQAL